MRIRLSTIIVVAGCCVAFFQEARASRMWGNTDTYYDASQNRMVGYAETTSSYSAGSYYCTSVSVFLYTEGQSATNNAWDGCNGGYSRAEASLPYNPNAEYTVDGEHEGDPYYRDGTGALIDYYNFQTYLEGIPVYYPGSYQFMGPGPRRPSFGAIFLGITNALFSAGTRHGQPHHLWVDSDSIVTGSCGRTERRITYQVVDINNRRAARTTVKEQFSNRPIYDSCSNYEVFPSPCFPTTWIGLSGKINDEIWVGIPGPAGQCPPSIDPSCGYIFDVNRWQWCPRDRPAVTLGTFTYDVHWDRIGINGRYTEWPVGGQFFP